MEEVPGCAALDDPSVVHHQDLVGDFADDGEVVRDEEDRETELAPEAGEESEDLRLQRRIERGRRLVRDQQLGAGGERHGHGRALSQAARQLVRKRARARGRLGHAAQVQHLLDASIDSGAIK